MLVHAHAAPLDRVGQPAGEQGRLQRRAVRREGRAEHAVGADQLRGPRRGRASARRPRRSRARVPRPPRPCARMRWASLRTRSTDPPLAKWQSMPSLAAVAAHDVHGLLHGPAHGAHRVAPVLAGQRGVGGGEERRAPAAVATRRAEAGHLALHHRDAQRGVGQHQRVRRPQAGEARRPTMQTSTSRSSVRAGRGAQRDRHGLPPQGEPLVARGPRPGALQPAPRLGAGTSRSVACMKSISSWPQMSGGDSWITGSPRSSARQISPASNRAPDRKPRSRRSDSSSSKERRVSLSFTSSIP